MKNIELLENFWNNFDEYCENDTVLEQIDEVFPQYLFENFETYQILFNELAQIYNEYYFYNFNVDIDFTISYGDAFRHIVNDMKKLYTETFDIKKEDIENIIHKMYTDKYEKYLLKEKISNIIKSLKK